MILLPVVVILVVVVIAILIGDKKWRWLMAVPLAGWVYLLGTSQGVLIREDPMFVNEHGLIQDVACIYSSGIVTASLVRAGELNGASCTRLYTFGSAPPCDVHHLISSGLCQDPRW